MIAKVIVFGRDQGGRDSSPAPGYRPHLDLGDVQTSCVIGEGDGIDHMVSTSSIWSR